MRQAFHIFRTNARRLWPQIALFVVVLALKNVGYRFALLLLPACWFLIAALVHQEAIPGHRQFWITRPYRWTSLLGAKVMFILIFIHAPLLVSDCVGLIREGFSPLHDVSGLIERQALLSLELVVPPLAIASVTSGITPFAGFYVPFALFSLAAWYGVIPMYINPGITGLDWLASQILAVAAGVILAVVIVRQYAARHTLSGRAGVVAALLLPFLPVAWNTALYATTLAIKPGALAPMRLEADPGRMAEWEGETCFSLPVKLVGADPSLDLDPLGARVAVDAPGFHLQGGWQRETSLRERGDGYREKVCMARSDYTRAVDQSDRHGTVAVTATVAFAAWPGSVQSRAWLGRGRVAVPGVGTCASGPFGPRCLTPLRPERRGFAVWEERGLHLATLTYGRYHLPFEVTLGTSPVLSFSPLIFPNYNRFDFIVGPNAEISFSTRTNGAIYSVQLHYPRVRLFAAGAK